MRMLVVGAGSTGGYFGGRLVEAGRDVTFLVRPLRADKLRADGLQIISPHGNITLSPKLVTADALRETYDVVLLTVKAYALKAALDDLAPAIGPETMILPVLNGMKHIDTLIARFGQQAVIGGVCKVATLLDGDGRIVQLMPLQDLAYGERDGKMSDRLQKLDAFMQGAGFSARLSPTIMREMWEKWILLATMGGMTTLMDGTIGEIEAAPGGLAFIRTLMQEVVSTVRAVGEAPSAEFLAGAEKMLTAKGSPQASSMYRDMSTGQAVEADQLLGDLLARGERANIAMPLVGAAYSRLKIYQARRDKR